MSISGMLILVSSLFSGKVGESMKVMKVFCRRGTVREELSEAVAGDIVSVAGINGVVGDTISNVGMG